MQLNTNNTPPDIPVDNNAFNKKELKIFGFIGLGILFLGVLSLFCEYYPFSQGQSAPSTRNLLDLELFISFPMIMISLCIVSVPFVLVACLFVGKIWRIRFILWAILPIFCIVIQIGLYRIVPLFKHRACLKIVSQGQTIIDTINSYKNDNGKYPDTLNALIPKYINKIPETGIRGFPFFEYELLNPAEYKYQVPEMGNKQIYELRVKLERLFKWDRVFYWPVEKYPNSIYGGDIEKIGKWAYVDE
jgi:hypothetical protein